jgi:hypothetical protein
MELDDASSQQIPESVIGRLLNDRDLRCLQRAIVPKKSPTRSVRRRVATNAGSRYRGQGRASDLSTSSYKSLKLLKLPVYATLTPALTLLMPS